MNRYYNKYFNILKSKNMILLPLLYILYLNFTCEIYAQNKQCTNCKYFIPYKNNKITSLGLCKMFGNKISDGKSNEKMIYNFAQHCREDENLCGKNATFYERLEIGIKLNETQYVTQNEKPTKNITDNNGNTNTYLISGKLHRPKRKMRQKHNYYLYIL
jgi:hypothetical protein